MSQAPPLGGCGPENVPASLGLRHASEWVWSPVLKRSAGLSFQKVLLCTRTVAVGKRVALVAGDETHKLEVGNIQDSANAIACRTGAAQTPDRGAP